MIKSAGGFTRGGRVFLDRALDWDWDLDWVVVGQAVGSCSPPGRMVNVIFGLDMAPSNPQAQRSRSMITSKKLGLLTWDCRFSG